ncbi:red chlorophyll catabolite reductase, chloroplastic [Senna tora]|uniref:Red chlorophyll catabolite reductase, chloroplastic n=1 Tax=Senna tora TaxID=362788 RepID=A0A834T4H3_9FABA|nr:red chlorophyll catabolite reductase, chloroplastic [Senna tora]
MSDSEPPLPSQRFVGAGVTRNEADYAELQRQEDGDQGISEKFLEYPFASEAHKKVMVDLVLDLENGLQNHLLPSTLPPLLQYYTNHSGSVQASFRVRQGLTESPIDLIWGSWVHYEPPNGTCLEITSFTVYLNSSNDAPHFVIDLIRHSPTMLVVILDLLPRKDLTLHPQYLKTFYEDTQLDIHRQAFEKLAEAEPYVSPSLYMRTTVSPTAILFRIETEGRGGEERLEEIIRSHLDPISKQVLKTWFENCVNYSGERDEEERECVRRRDQICRRKNLDIDLAPSFVQLFGEEDGNRMMACLKDYFFSE